MGMVGAGNVGHRGVGADCPAAGAGLRLAAVYGFAAVRHLLPMIVMSCSPRSRPTWTSTPRFSEHIACLFEKDGWAFSLIYAVTFGGFIGLATFLPTYYYDQFGSARCRPAS